MGRKKKKTKILQKRTQNPITKNIFKARALSNLFIHNKIQRDRKLPVKNTKKRFILMIPLFFFSIISIIFISITLITLGYIGAINQYIPDVGSIIEKDLTQSTKIFDRNGALLYTVFEDINREYVTIENIPEQTQWALLAAEDITFHEHSGIDYQGIISAILDYINGKPLRGASTLTQQLARNVVLTEIIGSEEAYDRSIKRKVVEALVSFRIEEKMTKNEILEMQMNEVFFGGTTYGYQTAARAFFNKDLSQLTLSENAYLAGIIQAPSFYHNAQSNKNFEVIKARRDQVLYLMYKYRDKTGITKEEYDEAKAEELVFRPSNVTIKAPHFVFHVIEELEKMYSPEIVRSGGLQVKTTLDLKTQATAERRLRESISSARKQYGVHNGAVVIIDPRNGQVLSMVGSVNYNNTKDKRVDGNVNVTLMPRQMGSSVKPYTYMAAFRLGYTPATSAPDRPVKYGNYKPENWDKKYYGGMSIRTALNLSRNVPAVYTLKRIGGTYRFLNEVERLGITTLTDKKRYGLSVTLGAAEMKLLEHTNAYAAFANSGVKYDPAVILNIKNSKGEEIYKYDKNTTKKRVYSTQETFLMNWILCQMSYRDKSASGLYYAGGQWYCGKTGTSTGPKDLITMGYYPKLVVGVWTGNNNGAKTFGYRGQGWSENVPIYIVRNIMNDLIPRYGKAFYSKPSGVAYRSSCSTDKDGKKSCKSGSPYIIGKSRF